MNPLGRQPARKRLYLNLPGSESGDLGQCDQRLTPVPLCAECHGQVEDASFDGLPLESMYTPDSRSNWAPSVASSR
jgi:hypothetical protein